MRIEENKLKERHLPHPLPCPFCGGKANLYYNEPFACTYYVRCEQCGIKPYESGIDSDVVSA